MGTLEELRPELSPTARGWVGKEGLNSQRCV